MIMLPVQDEVFYLDSDYTDAAYEHMRTKDDGPKTFEQIEEMRLRIIIDNIIKSEIESKL